MDCNECNNSKCPHNPFGNLTEGDIIEFAITAALRECLKSPLAEPEKPGVQP